MRDPRPRGDRARDARDRPVGHAEETQVAALAQTSHDGGAHFDAAVTIANFEGTDVPGMRTGIGLPAAAPSAVSARSGLVPRPMSPMAQWRILSSSSSSIPMVAPAMAKSPWRRWRLPKRRRRWNVENVVNVAVATG